MNSHLEVTVYSLLEMNRKLLKICREGYWSDYIELSEKYLMQIECFCQFLLKSKCGDYLDRDFLTMAIEEMLCNEAEVSYHLDKKLLLLKKDLDSFKCGDGFLKFFSGDFY